VYAAFRNDCLFGVEQSDGVFGLALVNMIFRGDGKSRIHNGNCFDNRFVGVDGNVLRLRPNDESPGAATKPFSRVLMNPPFAISDEKEREFVDYALDQMRQGGLLFAVLPNAPITGLKEDADWRRELLQRHTVRAVVKLSINLFRPSAKKGTYALVLEAWRPHRTNDPVFFGILHDDESASYRSKLLGAAQARDNLQRVTADLATFLRDGRARIDTIPQEQTVSTLNMDMLWDFSAEAYLEGGVPDLTRSPPVEDLYLELTRRKARSGRRPRPVPRETKDFSLQELFDIRRGKCPPLKTLDAGGIPVVTAMDSANGIGGFRDVPPDHYHEDCITISANGSGGSAFWHPYTFAATPDAMICQWPDDWAPSPEFCLYVCNAIRQNAWRFDYYRKSSFGRLIADVRITLPLRGDGRVDYRYIAREMRRMPGFSQLLEMLDG